MIISLFDRLRRRVVKGTPGAKRRRLIIQKGEVDDVNDLVDFHNVEERPSFATESVPFREKNAEAAPPPIRRIIA